VLARNERNDGSLALASFAGTEGATATPAEADGM